MLPFARRMYRISAELYLRALGLVYLAAFVSFGVQLEGLIGPDGIRPAATTLTLVARQLPGGLAGWLDFPTLAWWIGASPEALHATWIAGALCGAALVLGVVPWPAALVALLTYLSLVTLGREFMSFQWDNLLLEAGALALLLAPVRRIRPRRMLEHAPWWSVIALHQILVTRLVFSSGVSKIVSGDAEWSQLRALRYHFETQPLPTWVGWGVHQLPHALLAVATALVFVLQVVLPLLALFPGRARWAACAAIAGFQVLIALTGNYGFFNLLTLALAIPLLDDGVWRRLPPWREGADRAERSGGSSHGEAPLRWPHLRWLGAPLIATYAVASALILARTLHLPDVPSPAAQGLLRALAPLRLVNGYGLFAVMTTRRDELAVEGSLDGVTWRPYVFRYKPGPLDRAPGFMAPHMPRLDWQMWFAALGSPRQSPWLVPFLERLREGSPAVLGLLERDPFEADGPPAHLRVRIERYEMTAVGEPGWWRASEPRSFIEP